MLFVQDIVIFITSPLIRSCEILPFLLNCRTKLNSTNLKTKSTTRVSHRAVLMMSRHCQEIQVIVDSLINLLFLVYNSSPFCISEVTDKIDWVSFRALFTTMFIIFWDNLIDEQIFFHCKWKETLVINMVYTTFLMSYQTTWEWKT